ncbi:MAG: glucose-1-phosphate thymidylyltransferase [Planctomycetota bacterium]|nr:MAG: glucose-1-phosphate thymidylyltransferase [Planctomycetota bacterium]
MTILLYEDSLTPQLAPITTGRAAFCVTVASWTLLDIVRMTGCTIAAWTRNYLREILSQDIPSVQLLGKTPMADPTGVPKLMLNARTIPSATTLRSVQTLLQDDSLSGVVRDGDQIAAVVRPSWNWQQIEQAATSNIETLLVSAPTLPDIKADLKLMSFPHEVIAANMDAFSENIGLRVEHSGFPQAQDGVFMAPGARLGQYVLTETSDGPIVIDEGASVGPYTLLRGPLYIGPNCRILEHAAIKDAVSLGHTTKIGGEVEASVVEPFTNKQHHGFLGHSYLGSWINLGAGTCNSDLKNTYGTVNMEYPTGKAATGMQFLGCAMGDYSKTAINTGIFTGKVIGVCSMMYGFVTSNVPSFVNYARLFGQLATLPPEVMIATQQRMFRRRKVQQRPCDMQLIHDMYRITQSERDRFGDEIAF